MKVEEVPQDEKFFKGTNVRDVCYALDEDGNYQQVFSVGWEPKNEALLLTWEHINEEAESIRQEVLSGKKSPLAYYMKIHLFSVKMLAAYTGIPKRIVKKHLTADAFRTMDESCLKKYADTLNMTIDELMTISGD